MPALFDTNILLRRCLGIGKHSSFALSHIAEFWNVAACPAANKGLGMSHLDAVSEVRLWGLFKRPHNPNSTAHVPPCNRCSPCSSSSLW